MAGRPVEAPTHALPVPKQLLDPRVYKSSPTEVARNLAKLAKALPDHDRCDELLGKTRVVANPLGYPNEVESLEAFEPAFQVTV